MGDSRAAGGAGRHGLGASIDYGQTMKKFGILP